MMQTPSLLGYTNLSHLLEIRSHLAAAAAAAAARHHQQPQQPMAAKRPTPFSIDAILGLENGPEAVGINKQQSEDSSPLPTHTALTQPIQVPGCGSGDLSNKMDAVAGGVGKRPKSKRVRTIFTPEQLERLEAEFERQQYMVGPERLYLAHALQLTEAQVKVWFQNRRIKWRKQHLEQQQQRLAALKHLHHQQHLQVTGGGPPPTSAPPLEAELEDSEDTSSHSGDEQPRSSQAV